MLIQPYPDGVTTRRTSVMAGLANGCAVVTTDGKLTEDVWRAAGCVAMAPAGDTAALCTRTRELLAEQSAREALQARAAAAYDAYFALRHTIDALRADCPQSSAYAMTSRMTDRAPRLTVGITTRNRPESLRRCVDSLRHIEHLAPEILIFDDASEVPAAEVLAVASARSSHS